MNSNQATRLLRYRYARLQQLLQKIPNENTLLLVLAMIVGVGSGLGALAFESVIEFFRAGFSKLDFQVELAGLVIPLGRIFALVLGGLAGGALIHTVARSSKGHGVPDVMRSVAIGGGRIPARVAAHTSLTAGVCIGAGGSAGPEGPIVQIGASIGSTMGRITGMSSERLRTLAACGAAGGISAIFGAPLAGVFFAVEVILGNFAVQSLTPVVLSSMIAAVVHQAFVGWQPRFHVPDHAAVGVEEVPFLLLLGAVAAVVSVVFIRVLYAGETAFRRLPVAPWIRPAVGMAMVGLIALAFPEVLGDGYASVSRAFNGDLALHIMLLLVIAKLLATVCTVGSGNVGGLFAPSMVIGSMLGGAMGLLLQTHVYPDTDGLITVYALVGMGAVIAGTTHATISGILLVFELTNDYGIVLPAMLACATAVLLGSQLQKESIYSLNLVRAGIRLKRGVEVNVMSSIPVATIMKPPDRAVRQDLHLGELLRMLQGTSENTFPVVTDDNLLVGVISYQDIRVVLGQEHTPEMDALIVARDIATLNPRTVTPRDNLNDALRVFGMQDVSVLPVVEPGTDRLVGVLRRWDVLSAYRRALLEREVPDLQGA